MHQHHRFSGSVNAVGDAMLVEKGVAVDDVRRSTPFRIPLPPTLTPIVGGRFRCRSATQASMV